MSANQDFIDGHLPSCMLQMDGWDLACFTPSEVSCTCDLEGRSTAEIGRLRELLADALKTVSGKYVHASDCSTSNAPALTPSACDCGGMTPYERGYADAVEAAAWRADRLSRSQTLRLHAGEMTAQEARTCKAVAAFLAADIRALKPTKEIGDDRA